MPALRRVRYETRTSPDFAPTTIINKEYKQKTALRSFPYEKLQMSLDCNFFKQSVLKQTKAPLPNPFV